MMKNGATDEIVAEPARVVRPAFSKPNGAPAPVALSASREELRAAINRLAVARHAVDTAAAPLRRLAEVEDTARTMLEELHVLLRRDEERLGEYIAAGRVGRAPDDADTVKANAKSLAFQEDLNAARRVLPTHAAKHQEAIARSQAASSARDQAVADVIAQEIAIGIAEQMVANLNQALTHQAKLVSLADAMKQPDGTHTHSCNVVIGLIGAAQRSAAASPDPAFGRDMLDRLSSDPSAGLER
jgi:hypothetical protein